MLTFHTYALAFLATLLFAFSSEFRAVVQFVLFLIVVTIYACVQFLVVAFPIAVEVLGTASGWAARLSELVGLK